jgi:hypothetical protein
LRSLAPWIAKAVLSAAYWLGCLYVATGLFSGDRMAPDGTITGSPSTLPTWAFGLLAIGLYAALSLAWDRLAGVNDRH